MQIPIMIAILFTFIVLLKLIRKSLAFPSLLRSKISAAACPINNQSSPPIISVIIPAKDEGNHIEEAVKSILASEGCQFEVVLVDDRSRDDTLQVMKHLAGGHQRIKVTSIVNLPEGWTGKTHAMFKGAEIASGDILVFTDADAVLSPYALCNGISTLLSKHLGFLSFVPGFTVRGFLEDGIFPIMAAGLLHYFPFKEVNDPARPAALASGPFLMITRQAYQEIGTWSQLKNEITEDIAFAKAAKRKNIQLMVLQGSELVRVKPFRTMSEIFRYWKRVYYGGFDRNILRLIGSAMNHASVFAVYVLFAVSGVLWLSQATTAINILFALATIIVIVVSAIQIIFIRSEKGNWIYALASPFAFLMGTCVSLSAVAAVIFRRPICWHGSCYR